MTLKLISVKDPSLSVDFNVIVGSPHVVAYRVWSKVPGDQDWTKIAEGTTGDEVPDHKALGAFPVETTILYWLAVGGHPNTPFRVLVTFGQEGAVLVGGDCTEAGVVSDAGSVALKRKVELRA